MRKNTLAKKILSVVLAGAVALSSGAFGGLVFEKKAEAATQTGEYILNGITWYYTIENGYAVNLHTSSGIVDSRLNEGVLEVPSVVGNDLEGNDTEYPVRSIGDGDTEEGKTSFLKGTISASSVAVDLSGMEHLEEVVGYAFYNKNGNMDNVRVENLPEGVQTIGEYAFNGTVCGEQSGNQWNFSIPSSVEKMGEAALNHSSVRMEVNNPNMVYESKDKMTLYKAVGYANSTTKEIYGDSMGSISGTDTSWKLAFDLDGGSFASGSQDKHLVNYIYTYSGMTLPTVLSEVPVKEHYEFSGYQGLDKDSATALYYNADKTVNSAYAVDQGTTYMKAVWSPETYDVNFELNGGTWNEGVEVPKTYIYGTGVQLPDVKSSVTRTGYTPQWWYSEEGSSSAESSDDAKKATNIGTEDAGHKTFYLIWSPGSWLTKYYLNGAQLKAGYDYNYNTSGYYLDRTRVYNKDYAMWDVSMMEYPGYEFNGWYMEDTFKTKYPSTLAADSEEYAKMLSAYAKWTPKTYKISYGLDGGVLGKDTKYEFTFNQKQELPTVTKTGYDFMGWYDNVDCTGDAVSEVEVNKTNDLKYYAKWQPKSFGVTLETNGGTINSGNIVSYSYDKGAKLPKDVTKTGYDFKGWYDNASFREEPVKEIGANDSENMNSRTYFAKWTEHVYSVSLNENGGNIVNDVTEYTYGTETKLPVPEKEGFHFLGWYDAEGNKIENIKATDAKDFNLNAKWAAKQFPLEYDTQGGELSGNYATIWKYDTKCDLPTNLTRTGYVFNGWYAFGNTENTINTIAANDKEILKHAEGIKKVELKANWKPNTYTVTFNPNGGAVDNSQITVAFGNLYENLPVPKKKGYVFAGWYTELENGTLIDENTRCSINDNHFLHAHWEVAKWKVTFDTNGGEMEAVEVNVSYGLPYGELPTPSRKGYTFTGWNVPVELCTGFLPFDKVANKDTEVKIDKDHTLTAGWASNLDKTDIEITDGGNTDPGVYTDITEIELVENNDVPAWYQGRSDGYYYRHALDDTEKKIYAAFFNSYKGGYNIGSKLHFKMYSDLSYEKFYESVYDAVTAFCDDHPEFTACEHISVLFPVIEGNKNGVYYMECAAYSGYDRTLAISVNNALGEGGAYLDAVSEINIKKKDNDFQKVKKIHDYVVKRLCYATADANGEYTNEKRDPGYAFLNSSSENPQFGVVCVGYAELFKVFCNYYGIECILTSGSNHIWNNVQVDGKWYVVDCTGDDGIDEGALYDYFLIGNKYQFSSADRLKECLPELESKKYIMKKSVGGVSYKLTSANSNNVEVVGLTKAGKKKVKLVIPGKVKIGGSSYNVTKIGAGALAKSMVKTLVLGTKVKSIGQRAFYGCKNLAKVTIKSDKVTSFGKKAFAGTSKKLTVKVPKKVTREYAAKIKQTGNKKIVVK